MGSFKAYKYIYPNFFSRLFGCRYSSVHITKKGVAVENADGRKTTIQWKNIGNSPEVKKGIFFCKINITPSLYFDFLSLKKAKNIQKSLQSAWYKAHYDYFQKSLIAIQSDMFTDYVRSSKLQNIKSNIGNLVQQFIKPPTKQLAGEKVHKPYQLLSDLHLNFQERIDWSRDRFIQSEMKEYSAFFDKVESNPLTTEQRKACVIDDDKNLVLAGAGTGKTSTMVAKAGYLIKSGKAKPDEIILLAYGDDAAKEVDERIKTKLKIDTIKASTFHSLGKKIITKVEKKRISVSPLATDQTQLEKFVDEQFKLLLEDNEYAKTAIKYFSTYLFPEESQFDFKTEADYIKYLQDNDLRTLKGELVKSYQELLIANFFFINGIEYEYERKYPGNIKDDNFSAYQPDFYLIDSEVYLEHYGIDRKGNTAPWIDKEKYNEGMLWKKNLHRDNETELMETFHYQHVEGTLLKNLSDELHKRDVKFEPLPPESIFNTLKELDQIKPISKLLAKLLKGVKSVGDSPEVVAKKAKKSKYPEQSLAALSLLIPILNLYQFHLQENDQIDFDDMIHKAIRYIKDGRCPKFKYILVDEFQDIADSRAQLIMALNNNVVNSSIFCVGDDWQAIYRFTGSDIKFTTEFKKIFGVHSSTALDKTFRFNNMISSVASKFIMQNTYQVKKNISTHLQTKSISVSIYRTSNCCSQSEIETVLDQINNFAQEGSEVFVLARYGFLLKDFNESNRLYSNLKISSMTMHKSKGMEADYVIVIGLQGGSFGFPSEKITHPLFEAYLPQLDPFENAEERRLFYVAITRAKHKAFLLADMTRPSAFATELINDGYEVLLDEFEISDTQKNYEKMSCPKCKSGVLIEREGYNKFTGCSNYPYCKHTNSNCKCGSKMADSNGYRRCLSDDCDSILPICDSCHGHFVIRQNKKSMKHFWGCNNYRIGKSVGCDNSKNLEYFTDAIPKNI